jgi:catechol 2,3-dioxygenase-like lactoylglutathione lyase family enzyme
MYLTPHHTACAVETLEKALSTYADGLMLTRRSRAFDVSSQGVSVCFLELVSGFYLELVAPHPTQTRLAKYLRTGFYHLCFLTDDLAASRAHLKQRRFTALPAFSSEAFDGSACQFFLSPELHLIELAQTTSEDFNAFFSRNIMDR